LRIPAKLNASSGGKTNGIPGPHILPRTDARRRRPGFRKHNPWLLCLCGGLFPQTSGFACNTNGLVLRVLTASDMTNFTRGLIAAAALCISLTGSARANIMINFDDLTTSSAALISNGYQGFDWNNFAVLNTTAEYNSYGTNGYTNGTISAPNVAANDHDPASMSSTTPFTFNSAYFTGAWNNGLNITVMGLRNGLTEDTTTFTVSSTAPTLETFNWANIDELDFSASGGTSAGYSGAGEYFAMDNMTLNGPVPAPAPEPESWLLLGSAVLLWACLYGRQRGSRGASGN
jgi:hypothetical protein